MERGERWLTAIQLTLRLSLTASRATGSRSGGTPSSAGRAWRSKASGSSPLGLRAPTVSAPHGFARPRQSSISPVPAAFAPEATVGRSLLGAGFLPGVLPRQRPGPRASSTRARPVPGSPLNRIESLNPGLGAGPRSRTERSLSSVSAGQSDPSPGKPQGRSPRNRPFPRLTWSPVTPVGPPRPCCPRLSHEPLLSSRAAWPQAAPCSLLSSGRPAFGLPGRGVRAPKGPERFDASALLAAPPEARTACRHSRCRQADWLTVASPCPARGKGGGMSWAWDDG
jgi:hypothetical protein